MKNERKARVIGLLNQKGGVGKTTCTIYLGSNLANKGYRVLLIDFDTSNCLTRYLKFDECEKTITDLIENKNLDPKEVIINVKENMDLIPADGYLNLCKEINDRAFGIYQLDDLLRKSKLKEDYDFILVDASPTVSNYSYNVLMCSDEIIIPTSLSPAIETIEDVIYTVESINERQTKNKKIKISGILINRFQPSKTKNDIYLKKLVELRKEHGVYIYQNFVRDKASIERFETAINAKDEDFAKVIEEFLNK